jgi:hypothetical protein
MGDLPLSAVSIMKNGISPPLPHIFWQLWGCLKTQKRHGFGQVSVGVQKVTAIAGNGSHQGPAWPRLAAGK